MLTLRRFHPAQALLLALCLSFSLAAVDAAGRFDKLGHKIMCPCGCNELLGECNHVGCPDSDRMRKQLAARVNTGDSDSSIFHAFSDEYGPTALAAPMFTPFNSSLWFMPFIFLTLGLGAVYFIVRRWRSHNAFIPAGAASTAQSPQGAESLRDRIRRETEGDIEP